MMLPIHRGQQQHGRLRGTRLRVGGDSGGGTRKTVRAIWFSFRCLVPSHKLETGKIPLGRERDLAINLSPAKELSASTRLPHSEDATGQKATDGEQ